MNFYYHKKHIVHSSASVRGFTLLELVIVLSILSLMTLLLTESFTKDQHERRWNRSNETLDQLQQAIVGSIPYQGKTEEQPFFVGDLGRLPYAVTNQLDERELTLGELFVRPETCPPYGVFSAAKNLCKAAKRAGIRSLPMDEHVCVAMGWRGPYLHLPPGKAEPFVRDGWGNAFVSRNNLFSFSAEEKDDFLPNRLLPESWERDEGVSDEIREEITNRTEIAFIRHLGSDGLIGDFAGTDTEPTEGEDVVISPVSNAYTTAVSGYVLIPTNATAVRVRVYGPPPVSFDQNDAKRVMVWEWKKRGVFQTGQMVPFLLTNQTVRMSAGRRMLRACSYQESSLTNYSVPVSIRLQSGTTYLPEALKMEQLQP